METTEERQEAREAIAARLNAQVEEARALLGPAEAYGKWTLHDTTGVEPDRVVFCCRRSGEEGWHPNDAEAFGEELITTRRADGFPFAGRTIHLFRYQLWHGYLAEYHPMPAEELERRNETRKRKKAEKRLAADRQSMPLLAGQIGG